MRFITWRQSKSAILIAEDLSTLSPRRDNYELLQQKTPGDCESTRRNCGTTPDTFQKPPVESLFASLGSDVAKQAKQASISRP